MMVGVERNEALNQTIGRPPPLTWKSRWTASRRRINNLTIAALREVFQENYLLVLPNNTITIGEGEMRRGVRGIRGGRRKKKQQKEKKNSEGM